MARKIILQREDGSSPMLTETLASDEAQLQELIKSNPDLLPVDEFGMTGPILVVGRETVLPSGAVDLIGIARSGEILLAEFKTGPQNTDFRRVVAQLVDYGSDLWEMTYEEFEATVARRFFESGYCSDARVQRKKTLAEAANAVWPDLADEEAATIAERLTEQLSSGAFHYIVVAQRFAPSVERTIQYLNAVAKGARFYAVELVRFSSEALSAFEARTVLKPTPSRSETSPRSQINMDRLLEAVEDDAYRDALRELLEVCGGLGLRIEWGKTGASIRLLTPDRPDPVSIAWVFPTGAAGWMGFRYLILGRDLWSDKQIPSVMPALHEYVSRVSSLPGAEQVRTKGFAAYRFGPDATARCRGQIADIIAELVRKVSGGA